MTPLSSISGQAAVPSLMADVQASQSADTGTSALRGSVFGQAQEVSKLLASLQPNLGQNVNMTA